MHSMASGAPCGRPDGHNGPHRSVEAVKRQLERNRKSVREWIAQNPERHNENQRKWRANNPESRSEYYREWYLRNSEHKRAYMREYYIRRKQQAAGDSDSDSGDQ